jgi:hypothetical protein
MSPCPSLIYRFEEAQKLSRNFGNEMFFCFLCGRCLHPLLQYNRGIGGELNLVQYKHMRTRLRDYAHGHEEATADSEIGGVEVRLNCTAMMPRY